MPCTAKKAEIKRPEHFTEGKQDVDYVLTTTEVTRMIQEAGIDLSRIEPEALDMPFGLSSGAGAIFGVTGGVTEAVLRRLKTTAVRKCWMQSVLPESEVWTELRRHR